MKVDDQAGVGVGDTVQTLKQALDIGGQIQGIGNDNIVEARRKLELLTRLHMEFRLRHADAGGGDLRRRQVDPNFAGGPETGQQFTGTTADLKYGSPGGDEEIIVMREQFAIAESRAIESGRAIVIEGPNLLKVLRSDIGCSRHISEARPFAARLTAGRQRFAAPMKPPDPVRSSTRAGTGRPAGVRKSRPRPGR